MTTTIRDLQAQADSLKSQLDQAKDSHQKAEQATSWARSVYEAKADNYSLQKLNEAIAHERQARANVRDCTKAWTRINDPLSAGARISQLTQAQQVQEQRQQAAQTVADNAQQTVERLEGMLIVEKENLAIATSQAAADLLQAVKSGAESPTVPTVDHAPLNAIASALESGKSELVQAHHELDAIKSLSATTEHDLAVARSDAAFLSVLLLEADFKTAWQQYKQAADVANIEPAEVVL